MPTSPSSSGGGDESGGRRRRRGAHHHHHHHPNDSNRNNQFEGGAASSSRQRFDNEMWPEPFLEALAYHVATDAARNHGRLAAAPAISNFFQVCSTWQAISRSNHLWQNLSRHIWGRQHRHLLISSSSSSSSWRDQYITLHRTASNFRTRRAVFTNLQIGNNNAEQDQNLQHQQDGDVDSLICRRLALSDFHLACGFVNGSIRVFDLTTRLHLTTLRPQPRDLLGHFSRAVSGIILLDDNADAGGGNFQVVFASLDGDVHVAVVPGQRRGRGRGRGGGPPRRVQLGNVVNDGTLVDFSGCRRWWVGLYAGVPGRSFHVWNAESEELLFVGGSLTDPESVMGWHLLTDLNHSLGRIRMMMNSTSSNHHHQQLHEAAAAAVLACTTTRLISLNLGRNYQEEEIATTERRGVVVDSVDVSSSSSNSMLLMLLDTRRVARILQMVNQDFQEMCRFRVRGGGPLAGCINGGCAFISSGGGGGGGGAVGAWDIQRGEFLYNLTDNIGGQPTALIADDRYIALASTDTTIHLWDFTAV